jgi:hypothetical protein
MTSPKHESVPSVFMLIPGPWQSPLELVGALAERGIHASALVDAGSPLAGEFCVDIVEDDALCDDFSMSRSGRLDPELVELVAACTHAALVAFGGCVHEDPAKLVRLGCALRDLGGVAIRMEASGAASSWESWLTAFQSGDLASIYASCVLLVGDESETFTCGMHQFNLPDAQIAGVDPSEATTWLDMLCLYQLAEDPVLLPGHTFRPDPDAEPRVLERWPDSHHGSDDGRHNPFGQWRIQRAEVARVTAGDLVLVIIPSLVARLTAAEDSKGEKLSQSEVEALTSDAAAIAMEPRDALVLERSRGYADIEPELAWEQWQIVRRATRE